VGRGERRQRSPPVNDFQGFACWGVCGAPWVLRVRAHGTPAAASTPASACEVSTPQSACTPVRPSPNRGHHQWGRAAIRGARPTGRRRRGLPNPHPLTHRAARRLAGFPVLSRAFRRRSPKREEPGARPPPARSCGHRPNPTPGNPRRWWMQHEFSPLLPFRLGVETWDSCCLGRRHRVRGPIHATGRGTNVPTQPESIGREHGCSSSIRQKPLLPGSCVERGSRHGPSAQVGAVRRPLSLARMEASVLSSSETRNPPHTAGACAAWRRRRVSSMRREGAAGWRARH
jgi:hypothetical protein